MHPSELSLPDLWQHVATHSHTRRLLELARDEDLPTQTDITSLVAVPVSATTEAHLVARVPCTLAGAGIPSLVISAFGSRVTYTPLAADSDRLEPGQRLGTLAGNTRDILAIERTTLNLIARLTGIATLTQRYTDAVAGTTAKVCDTRKTTPGLRLLEKYAVRCGHGSTHRLSLSDAVLIKDNHIANIPLDQLTDHLTQAATKARDIARRAGQQLLFVEVEVDTLDQLDRVLAAVGIDIILLDNFSTDQLEEAVRRRNTSPVGHRPELEASGGVTLSTISTIACTDVDRISVGSLTHGAHSVDIGLDIPALAHNTPPL